MDQTDFKRHIIPMQSAMQMLAERMLGDIADAEDVVQDVFVSLWSRRDELDRVVKPEAYCMQMVRTRCIDLLRKRRREAAYIQSMSNIQDVEIMAEVEETVNYDALLGRLLDELPEKQRIAVKMKYIDQCSTSQMEAALQMSSSNVYTTLSRAVQTLRDKLNRLKI